ncbi:MAG: UDP-3-O-(3-hydroxymyristoyl)glucosamine N-acyltransferase, partial [bacterium]|nr:UDP-3-O-(3-hydroxymyristoyl)glucosamine N-acyltransferase [bacterium]
SSIEQPRSGCIAFVEKPREASRLESGAIAAVVTTEGHADLFPTAIIVSNPKPAFGQLVRMFAPEPKAVPGVHRRASVAKSATVDRSATIGACAVIDEGASVGARTIVAPCAVLGRGSSVGADCAIGPNVSIHDGVRIGDRVVINAGTVIGAPGFGFVSSREKHERFPQVGGVVIEDDVEIGSNCCIDRASIDDTVIKRGTKIDNLVQLAHGVSIGVHTMIAAQTGISGGTSIGDWCVVGGQAGFQGHITVGDQSIVAAQSGVFSDLPAKSKGSGYPAKPHAQSLKILALTHRLPEMLDRMRSLEIELELMRGELQSMRDLKRDQDDMPPHGQA